VVRAGAQGGQMGPDHQRRRDCGSSSHRCARTQFSRLCATASREGRRLDVVGEALAKDEDRASRASDAKLMLRLAKAGVIRSLAGERTLVRAGSGCGSTTPRPATQIVVMGHPRPRTPANSTRHSPSVSGLSQAWSPASATPSTGTSGKRHWHVHCPSVQRSVTEASPRPKPHRGLAHVST
jgi:hypothetical protein